MTREEILQSLHALEGQLRKFEEQYRLRSDDFYHLAQDGRLEQSADFIEWLGLYEIKCKREQQYRRLTDALLSPLLKMEPAAEKKLVLPLVESARGFSMPPTLEEYEAFIPAPALSFARPNLPFLLQEIEQILLSET
jgi:hypothetical protein